MKKTVKKVWLILAVIIAFPLFTLMFTACGDRTEVLKIYNWGEYIADGSYDSMNIIAEFEDWYKEQTGKNIRVEYTLFDTNETMYTQINSKRADYDLVCPSDYMVEKMVRRDLLLQVNDEEFEEIWAKTFEGEDPELYGLDEDDEITMRSIMNPLLTDLIATYDTGWSAPDGEIYSVPYQWGTFGIMYDRSKVEELGGDTAIDDMQSWSALFGETYSNHIYMKNSVRDAYGCANIYNSTDALSEASDGFTDYDNDEYRGVLANCFNYPNDQTISSAEATLKKQKPLLYGYESDEGKNDLMSGKSRAALGLFWSCDAGYVIGQEENLDLWYSVPYEGTNLWVDNWSIPKYAGNITAAKYFISFINRYEVAYENMWWIGSAVPIKSVCDDITLEITDPQAACDLANAELEDDDEPYTLGDFLSFADYYYECEENGNLEDWQEYVDMYAAAITPTDEHLLRSAVMTDFSDKNIDLVRMFIRVKAS